ncbi:MAG: PBP1b-binding outer membrane lipoprotein LpoB [Candidatus Paceibacteria bacterium]|jgi:PBP1b-binding outer membrane lipoprotein LpoB
MKNKTLLLLPFLALLGACQTGPKRIDPGGDEAVVSAGVDFAEIIEWTDTLTQRMLASGFLDSGEFGTSPIKMVVSTIENKTDLSHFPTEILLSNIRTSLLQSGKARWVSTYGSDAKDEMTRDTQELKDDPLFDSSQVPETGQASVARLSLRTQVLWTHSQGVNDAQNTYLVRMWVTDVRNGEVIWENRSNPIAKKFEKGSVSW